MHRVQQKLLMPRQFLGHELSEFDMVKRSHRAIAFRASLVSSTTFRPCSCNASGAVMSTNFIPGSSSLHYYSLVTDPTTHIISSIVC